MFTENTIARPYSRAAFQFALAHHVIEKWQEMLMFATQVSTQEQIKNLIAGPLTPALISQEFIRICGNQLDVYGQNFIKVIAENKRLFILNTIFKQFQKLRTKYESVFDIDVISSVPINTKQLNKIKNAMEKRLLSNIRLHCKIDNSIISGIVLKVDDMIIDSSLRTRIERLTRLMIS
ncbi:F0F1 ATP synthase subunit delta [Candidatus Erwinia haradaeae]|uniref:ATP synthase subunit delta n=1 Tax=Candidatus Erwinia haradaeae TaxID=1922217 RepID=A0A451D1J4_9GAMM|nr:F0F1 ATP synthase subunit delta [Candidatus Erwinia haradaeae]VFP79477.1 ATP synthase subunit delta [Candidatus Erwinia haradaeae]